MISLGLPLASGRTADIFAWGDGQVLKLYQPGVPAADADHEWAMTAAVSGLGLPAPRCYGRVNVAGRPGLIFERLAGPSLLDVLLRDPLKAAGVAEHLGALHAAVHAAPAAGLPALHARLAARIGEASRLAPAWRVAATERLRGLNVGDVVCHGDFHPGNILSTPTGPVIIDWLDVSAGNPLADVARTVMLLRCAAPPPGPQAWEVSDALRSALVDAYLHAYRTVRPAADADLAQWLPVIAAARLVEGTLPEQVALFSVLEAAFGPREA